MAGEGRSVLELREEGADEDEDVESVLGRESTTMPPCRVGGQATAERRRQSKVVGGSCLALRSRVGLAVAAVWRRLGVCE